MYLYKEKTALITGASMGIGETFARTLAAKGMHLILVARSQEKLSHLAEALIQQHGVHIDVVVADLSQETAAQTVYNTIQRKQQRIDLLINNAGVTTYGRFDQQSLQKQQDEIQLNVTTVVSLTHLFLQAMIQDGHGAIINVASTGGFLSLPYQAVYSGTKAFIVAWSEALWAETRRYGIPVITLCPGATDTTMYQTMEPDYMGIGKRVSPEHVVRTGLQALEKGKMTVIDGRSNYWSTQFYRVLPRRVLVNLSEQMLRPKSVVPPKKEERSIPKINT